MGHKLVSERLFEHISPSLREYLDAVAEGINHYIELVATEELPPPSELEVGATLLGADSPAALMKPWDVQDLAAMVAVVMYETNYETGDVGRDAKVRQHEKLFEGVETHLDLRKEGFTRDVLGDIRGIFSASSTSGFGLEEGDGQNAQANERSNGDAPPPERKFQSKRGKVPFSLLHRLAERLKRFDHKIQRNRIAGFGSNAWAVAGSSSKDGASLVAGDGHLQLSVPALMYQVGLNTELLGDGDIHQLGLLLTTLPVLAVGTNGDIAWSQVNPVVDVTDWYREEIKLNAQGLPEASYFQEEWKALEVIEESYTVADVPALSSVGRTEKWKRWATFDGRLVADIEGRPATEADTPGEGEALVNMQGDLIIPADTDGDGIITAISFDHSAFDATQYLDTLDALGRVEDVYSLE